MKSLLGTLKSENNKKEKEKPKKTIVPEDTLDLETSLVTAIDGMLESSNGPQWKQSEGFAPSGTNQCPRFMVYRMRGYTQEQSFRAQTKRIFEIGNKVEDSVGELFSDLGILRDSQIEFHMTDPIPMHGFIDFLIDFDGEKPVECKSINDAGFMWRKLYHKPKDEHYRQLQFYLLWGGWDEGYLFYYCKNDSAILPLLIKRNDEFLDKLVKKYAIIYEVFKKGNLPQRPYKMTSAKCSKCDAFKHCWEDSEEGVPVSFK